jgi:hypothetical protein
MLSVTSVLDLCTQRSQRKSYGTIAVAVAISMAGDCMSEAPSAFQQCVIHAAENALAQDGFVCLADVFLYLGFDYERE